MEMSHGCILAKNRPVFLIWSNYIHVTYISAVADISSCITHISAVADIDSCITHIIAVAATVNINSLNKNLIFYGSFLSSHLVLQSGLKEGYLSDLVYIHVDFPLGSA